MKTFVYKAKNISGETTSGKMLCEDYNDFLQKINERGLFCISYRELAEKLTKKSKKLKTKDLAVACRQMSAMMSAGVTLVKSLDILYKEQTSVTTRAIWQDIYEEVQKGSSFSEALKTQPGAFPAFFVSMVTAGESSGSLDVVMERMSEHYLKETKMNNKIRGAMMYPIILCSLSIVIVIGLFVFVLPQFMSLFESSKLPPLTKAMMDIIKFGKSYWFIIVFLVGMLVAFAVYAWRTPKYRFKFDKKILTMKVVGKLVGKVYTGRFARTLSSLYSSGTPMIECIDRSIAVLGNSYISKRFEEVIENIKQGESLSRSILLTGVLIQCSVQ